MNLCIRDRFNPVVLNFPQSVLAT